MSALIEAARTTIVVAPVMISVLKNSSAKRIIGKSVEASSLTDGLDTPAPLLAPLTAVREKTEHPREEEIRPGNHVPSERTVGSAVGMAEGSHTARA